MAKKFTVNSPIHGEGELTYERWHCCVQAVLTFPTFHIDINFETIHQWITGLSCVDNNVQLDLGGSNFIHLTHDDEVVILTLRVDNVFGMHFEGYLIRREDAQEIVDDLNILLNDPVRLKCEQDFREQQG